MTEARQNYHLKILARVLDIDLIELFLEVGDLLRLDEDVRGLAAGAAAGLVDHDPGVRETVPHALSAGGQEEAAHAAGLAHTPGADRGQDVLRR